MKESVYKSYDELPLFLNAETVAKLLGIHRNSVYNMVNKRHLFITVKADDKIRIYKDSFEAWYKSQNRHTIVAS